MTQYDKDTDDKMIGELQQTWANMDKTFPVTPAPLHDWVSLVQERRRLLRKKLWRDLMLLWAVAIPFIFIILLLASGLSPWFWILEGVFVAAGIPLLVSEFRSGQRNGEVLYE